MIRLIIKIYGYCFINFILISCTSSVTNNSLKSVTELIESTPSLKTDTFSYTLRRSIRNEFNSPYILELYSSETNYKPQIIVATNKTGQTYAFTFEEAELKTKLKKCMTLLKIPERSGNSMMFNREILQHLLLYIEEPYDPTRKIKNLNEINYSGNYRIRIQYFKSNDFSISASKVIAID